MPVHRLDEVGHLAGALRVDDAAEARSSAGRALEHAPRVRDHADRDPFDEGRPADHLRSVLRLELVEPFAVEDALKDVVDLVRLPVILGKEVVQLVGQAPRWRRHALDGRGSGRELADELTQPLDARLVVRSHVVCDGADLRVHAGAAELLGTDALTGRSLDEVRSPEAHEGRALDHEDHVGERREVRAAGDARPHDRRELRDAQVAAHHRVVVEDAGRAVLPRKHAALVGQVHAGRVHEVDDRDAAAHRDLLGAQDLLDRLGPPRAGLHGRVVGDHDDLAPPDPSHRGDHPGGRSPSVVEVVGDEEADLHARLVGVEQPLDPLARRELALSVLTRDPLGSPALPQARPEILELRGKAAQPPAGTALGTGRQRHREPSGGHPRARGSERRPPLSGPPRWITSPPARRTTPGRSRSPPTSASPGRRAGRSPSSRARPRRPPG